jgi:hypothetical protein
MSDEVSWVGGLVPFLLGHESALWKGKDDEFAGWVHETFGIPTTIRTVAISPPPSASGRATVMIVGQDGAILFVLVNAANRQLEIKPFLIGPIFRNPKVVENRNVVAAGSQITDALTELLKRHVPLNMLREYLTPQTL